MKKFSLKLLSSILIILMLFTTIQVFFIKSEVNAALSSSYTQYVKSGINAFPESYQRKLAYLITLKQLNNQLFCLPINNFIYNFLLLCASSS